MVHNSRKGMLFGVLGLLVGVAAGAVGMMSLRGGDGPYATSPPTNAMGAGPASTAFVTAVAGNCEMAPVLPSAGEGDGRERLQAQPGAASSSEVAALILAGKEAAAAGRQRDAEIDFLNACRNAATLKDGDPAPLADAMYQLGRHYANVAAFGQAGKGKDLFQRAERLYSASLEGFRARYGDDHEKTKFAREGLLTVQQATGGKAPVAIAKAPPAPAAAPAPAAPVVAAPASAPTPTVAAAAPDSEAKKPAEAAARTAPESVATAPVEAPRASPEPRPKRRAAAPQRSAPVPVPVPERASESEAQADAAPPPVTERRTQRPVDTAAERRPPPSFEAEVQPPRPRPQVRRAPPPEERGIDTGESEVAIDTPPPPPRRPRPQPLPPTEPIYETPAPSSPADAGGIPSAEGSPSAP